MFCLFVTYLRFPTWVIHPFFYFLHFFLFVIFFLFFYIFFFFFFLHFFFLGIYLSDLVFVDDGNKDYIDNEESGLINFNKFRHIANIIKSIIIYQEKAFNFTHVPVIHQFVFETPILSQKDMHNRSLELEPRAN